MSDRHEQARAEAERRWPGKMALAPVMKARFLDGVEWADANPQPHTITREQFQGLIDYCDRFRAKRSATDDEHARIDAYAWGFVETAVDEYLHDLGIEVEGDE